MRRSRRGRRGGEGERRAGSRSERDRPLESGSGCLVLVAPVGHKRCQLMIRNGGIRA